MNNKNIRLSQEEAWHLLLLYSTQQTEEMTEEIGGKIVELKMRF